MTQRDPVREWREQYARCCLHLDFDPIEGSSFHASVVPIFDGLPIVRTSLSAGFVFRDSNLVQDGDINFGFLISQSRILDSFHQRREVRSATQR